MGIREGSSRWLGEVRGSAAARHERPPAHDEPDQVASLVDERHEAWEVGDRRRAVVAVGALERLELAQVLAERGQDDGLLVHGCEISLACAATRLAGPRRSLMRGDRVAQTPIVSTPIARRMRSASAFWPPVKAAMT